MDTIIHENNLTRHLILQCNTFTILNYLCENISFACYLSIKTDFLSCIQGYHVLRIWGDKDDGYGGTVAL